MTGRHGQWHPRKSFWETLNTYIWRRQWHPTLLLLPGKSHGQRSLVGCSPWGCKDSDMTERLYFHFSLSCIGEGNGNPLQCSCLKNPRDGGAWWAAVYGISQSWTWLKRLSSSSSKQFYWAIFSSFFSIWDTVSIPGLQRSLGDGNGNPLQYFCLWNPMDRGVWWGGGCGSTIHGVTESHTQLSD